MSIQFNDHHNYNLYVCEIFVGLSLACDNYSCGDFIGERGGQAVYSDLVSVRRFDNTYIGSGWDYLVVHIDLTTGATINN